MSDLQVLFNGVMFFAAIIFMLAAILVSLGINIGFPFLTISSAIFAFNALSDHNYIKFLVWTVIIAWSCRKMATTFKVPEFTDGKEDEECTTRNI